MDQKAICNTDKVVVTISTINFSFWPLSCVRGRILWHLIILSAMGFGYGYGS